MNGLLWPHEPATVRLLNPSGRSAFLLLGDHAGRAIPETLGDLGLAPADLTRHIAWDIGVRDLGEALSAALDATFIAQTWSRLVIDCNRDPGASDAMPLVSDGTVIPGNQDLGALDMGRRILEVHDPYHRAIAEEIRSRLARSQTTILVSLHSFTPVMAAFARPWQAGVLYDGGDPRFARAVLAALTSRPDLTVGDNQPYRMDTVDYTVPRHAYAAALPYVELEIRQDLLAEPGGVAEWAAILAACLRQALEDTGSSDRSGSNP